MKRFTDEQIYRANHVSIYELAKQLGYNPEKRGSNYHLKNHGGLYIDDTKNSFYCWAAERGGGPIQFLMFTENKSWLESMKYLVGDGEIQQTQKTSLKQHNPVEEKHVEFKLPDKASPYKRLFAYLIKTRGLDKDIVSDLVYKKKIYESLPHHNIVFVGYDENGEARQAFQRGTVTGLTFKGVVPGSNMNYCFAMEGKGDSLTVYEAAIDAISHASICKSFGMGWKKEHRIALGCLSDNALAGYLKRHPEIKNITFALDNDDEAKFSNGRPAPNWGQEAANKYADKYAKLGYNTTIEKPLAKDWNEDLLNIRLVQQDLKNRHEEDRLQLLMVSNEELEATL